MFDENQRIRLAIYDDMVDGSGVDMLRAAQISQQIGTMLRRDETLTTLYVIKVSDSEGSSHDVVTSKLTDSSVVIAGPIDVPTFRAIVRQKMADDRAVDERLQNNGTEI